MEKKLKYYDPNAMKICIWENETFCEGVIYYVETFASKQIFTVVCYRSLLYLIDDDMFKLPFHMYFGEVFKSMPAEVLNSKTMLLW